MFQILIVEDDKELSQLFQKVLEKNGYQVKSASDGFYTTTNTMYYVTFQMESGDRMEFQVSGIEYGMLAEGDTGELTFQGTRYLAFER